MDAPPVRYVRSPDGVSLATWTLGEGYPLIVMTAHGGDITREWDLPEYRHAYETLAADFHVIGFDMRNYGLSDRGVPWTVEALVADLAAVANTYVEGPFALFGPWRSGPIAIRYTAENPGRVATLVLWQTWARGETVMSSAQIETFLRMKEGDWHMYGLSAASVIFGLQGTRARQFADYFVRSLSQSDFIASQILNAGLDVTVDLGKIGCPALVMYRQDQESFPASISRELAAGIPNARLVAVPGLTPSAFFEGADENLRRISEFVRETTGGTPAASNVTAPSAFRTILFTDLEGHTAIMSRLGDAKGRQLLREHERLTREALHANGGTEVKSMGDGVMASFGSAQAALDCARSIQSAFSEPVLGEALKVRIGVNAGEPVADGDDLFGASVITAARIAAKAAGGQVLVANVVRELVAGKGFLFHDTGQHELKGLEEPVRIWELRLD